MISSKDFWIFDPDSYDSTTKLYGDFTVIKGSSKKEDSDMKQCSYFFEIGNQDNHGFKPIAIKYDEAEGFLIVEGEQQPMGKNKKRVFQIGEEARRYKNMRGPRHSVDVIVVSKDSKKTEIKDYLKQEQDGSKSAETFQADTLNQINPIFVEGAESFDAETCGWCGDEIVNGGKRDGEKVCNPCVVAYDKENNRGSPCVVCDEKTEMGAYSFGKGEWVSICSKDCELEYDDYEAESFEAESEIFCAECGGRRKYDAESFEAEHSCGCGDEMALEAELIGAKAKGKKFLRVGDLKKALKKTKDTDKVIAGDLYDEKVYLTTKVFKDGNQVAIVGQDGYHYYDDHMDDWDAESFEVEENTDNVSVDELIKHLRENRWSYEQDGEVRVSVDDGNPDGVLYLGNPSEDMEVIMVDNLDDSQRRAESFESEGVIEAIQQNLNDKDFVNYAYKVLIGGDAKTFEEKSMAIAETMNQNANNEDFTSFVEDLLFKDAEDDEISCSCESPRIRHAGVHPRTCKACDLVVDAEDVVELVQEVSPFPMGKLFASFIVVGASAIAGAHYHKKLLNR